MGKNKVVSGASAGLDAAKKESMDSRSAENGFLMRGNETKLKKTNANNNYK